MYRVRYFDGNNSHGEVFDNKQDALDYARVMSNKFQNWSFVRTGDETVGRYWQGRNIL